MLLKRDILDRIVAGEIDLVFRRWKRPTVRTGGTLRTQVGMLAIQAVDVIDESTLTDDDALRAGYASLEQLRAELAARPDPDRRTFRIRVAVGGADPRVRLRERHNLDDDERAELDRRLERLDARAPHGPWTRATLELIGARPFVRAADLAADLGRERTPFKADVAKLKRLGLTISHSLGYELSPRGIAYLDRRTGR